MDPEEVLADGTMRTADDMFAAGVSKQTLWRSVVAGRVEQVVKGVYCAPSTLGEAGLGLAAISLANPGSVICILSAARFHEITDEDPYKVWVAVRRSVTKNPARDGTMFRAQTIWWRDVNFESGVETRSMLGVNVRITDPARTVVDLIHYRGKIGDEPAMRALHDYVRMGGSLNDLWNRARAVDHLDAVEPFVRAADEFRGSMAVMGARHG